MIVPSGIEDFEAASDKEIIAAYLAEGFEREYAERALGIIRGHPRADRRVCGILGVVRLSLNL